MCRDLIVVACHAAMLEESLEVPAPDLWKPKYWDLADFQKYDMPFFREHCLHGIQQAVINPNAILMFSGGKTSSITTKSEAESYFNACCNDNFWLGLDDWEELSTRIMLEEYARDSFENILFSIMKLHQETGNWPRTVTVVSWRFKAMRFELHRRALGLTAQEFNFEGVNDPFNVNDCIPYETKVLTEYVGNPFGNSPAIQEKKAQRNPHNQSESFYRKMNGQTKALLAIEGDCFNEQFPWQRA